MPAVYVSRQPSVEGDAVIQELLRPLLDRLGASTDWLQSGQMDVPDAPDARVRLCALGGGLAAVLFLLEPTPGETAAVVAGVWPEAEALERAQNRVLQVNPVNGLPEFSSASTPEEAAEKRADQQRTAQEQARWSAGPGGGAGLGEPVEAEIHDSGDAEEREQDPVEAAKWARVLAIFERLKAEAAEAGTPFADDVEWYGGYAGGEPKVIIVTEEMRLQAEAEAEQHFEGITARESPIALTGRLGIPHEVLIPAWDARSQEELDAAIAACENEWHRRMLLRLAEHAELTQLLTEFGITPVVVPEDREATRAESIAWERAFDAVMVRWDAGDFVDEPVAPWMASRVVLGTAASDAEVTASFEHPTAALQFTRVR